MKADPPSEIDGLLTGPVLATREGCRRRVMAMSLGQRWRLSQYFKIDIEASGFEEDLARRLHRLQPRRKRRRTSVTKGTGNGTEEET